MEYYRNTSHPPPPCACVPVCMYNHTYVNIYVETRLQPPLDWGRGVLDFWVLFLRQAPFFLELTSSAKQEGQEVPGCTCLSASSLLGFQVLAFFMLALRI